VEHESVFYLERKLRRRGCKETLVNLEKQSWEAWKNRDAKFFQNFLSDDHVEVGFGGPTNKAVVVNVVGSPACVVKSYSVDRFELTVLTRTRLYSRITPHRTPPVAVKRYPARSGQVHSTSSVVINGSTPPISKHQPINESGF
jgi:hypothetical protein